MVKRLDYRKDFNFDCLQYSVLYYPSMNFIRLFCFFLSIGAATEFSYVQYSVPIVAQVVYIMFGISCPGYIRKRDKIIYVIFEFLMIVIMMNFILIGLAESVKHSEVSIISETVIFGIFIPIFIVFVVMIIFDIIAFRSDTVD